MRHLAAYLLLALNENETPTAEKIQNVLGSVGVEADEKQLKVVIEKFAGRSPSEIIAQGQLLLSSVASVSAGAAPSGGAAAPAAAAAAPAAKEEKKEEKPEPEEESDDDMGFGLFD